MLLPAPAVTQTSPVIMPCTAPITEGLPKKMTSRQVQVRRLVAALTLVLSTATDAVMSGAYGAPPLNPAHPSHSSPPPAIMSRMLFGANLSLSLFSLGPTCQNFSQSPFAWLAAYQTEFMSYRVPRETPTAR